MSLANPSFRYVPSFATDIRKTFARVRREQRQSKPSEVVIPVSGPAKLPQEVLVCVTRTA